MAEYRGNFNDQTRAVIDVARQEAAAAGAESASTRHLLMALLRDRNAAPAQIVATLGADVSELEQVIGENGEPSRSEHAAPPDRRWSTDAKSALVLSMQAARDLGHDYVGPEHLLLGVLRSEDGIAAQALRRVGVSAVEASECVRQLVAARRLDAGA
jgi:ATP-dependent Clp protease ATP-binding subunit ClpC